SDGATARCDVARGADRRARAREVLRISGRRAEGAVQSAQPQSGLTPRKRNTPFIPAHSASIRALTPVFDGLWTRVNALMAGSQSAGSRFLDWVPGAPTHRAPGGPPRGGRRGRML